MKRMIRVLSTGFFGIVLLLSSPVKAYTAEQIAAESKKVNEFLDKKFDESVERNPEMASNLGLKINYGKWTDRSDDFARKEVALAKENLASIKANFDLKALDAQTALSVKMYEDDINRNEEGLKWLHYSYEVSQLQGVHDDVPAFLINVHKIDSVSDALAYISRLRRTNQLFEQTIENLKKSEELGILPPYFTFKYVTDDIKAFIAGCDKNDSTNVLLTDFTTKVEKLNIAAEEKLKLEKQVSLTLKTIVRANYEKLLSYWLELEPKAKTNGSNGVWKLPKGVEYYAYMLRYHTTTNLTADQIFDIGTKEVERIHKEMQVIMKKVKFKNDSLQSFFAFMLSDPPFKYTNDDAGKAQLLADATAYIDNMRPKLPELFGTLPKAPLTVMKVEKFREKSAAGAFYEDPAEDGSRPGRYYVNTYNMDNEPKFQMEALTCHEAIPGHHMQIAIAQELRGVPKFRRHELYTSYVEGWALYCEKLGKEVGKYQDPYSDFGRLSMEVFRAARLVVDVGIHYKHWTREQAIDYFVKNTANAKGDIDNEIERYFLWPGQATAYKIGMIKIMELREKAKKALGSKFDIRKFHDVVLTNGAVTLNTLESLVDNYIAKTQAAK